ncbi:glycoside hydrolase family 5 protein [bacterium]|nr:glycoside hydrolase family 5 protein [bacterium]
MGKVRLNILAALVLAVGLASAVPAAAEVSVAWPETVQRGANLGGTNYSEADIAYLALDWRANLVRVLVNVTLTADGQCRVNGSSKETLFNLIDWCLKYRMYTVFCPSPSFDSMDELFGSRPLKNAFIAFWKEVAARYASAGPIAYDLLNEPHDGLADTQWSAFAQELTDSIRTVDKVHTLVVEPPAWGWPDGFTNLTPTTDSNTVYSFHFYGPMDYTHQRFGGQVTNTPDWAWLQRPYPGTIVSEWGSEYWDKNTMKPYIQKAVYFRTRHKVRLWCGEFGCARWAIGAKQWFTDWIDLLDENGIDWSYYSYREWQHMDIEMDPAERHNPTARSETELVTLFRSYYARNAVPADFNRDGALTLGDAAELVRYECRHPGNLAGDFNGDGKVGLLDVLGLLLRLGRGGE